MTHFASREPCAELFQLTGLRSGYTYYCIERKDGPEWIVLPEEVREPSDKWPAAYNLGFLLRVLPRHVYDDKGRGYTICFYADDYKRDGRDWFFGYRGYGTKPFDKDFADEMYDGVTDGLEDAAAELAIELAKAGKLQLEVA